MDDLASLYRQLILEHSKHPRHASLPAHASHRAQLDNPLCGDRVVIGLEIDADRVLAVGFEGRGCAISIAAASMMTEAVQGKRIAEVRASSERYLGLVAARAEVWPPELGALAAFSGVSRYPARAKCAALAWNALQIALSSTDPVDVVTPSR